MALSPNQVRQWREHGFCVSHCAPGEGDHSVLTSAEADQFKQAANHANLSASQDFGGLGFPFLRQGMHDLNQLALHPLLIASCQQLLGEKDLVLSQAELWFKQGNPTTTATPIEYRNLDQRMHMDFPNHYLACPPDWYSPDAVAMIVYLDNSDECGGGETRLVPRQSSADPAYQFPQVLQHMPGVGRLPWINDRQQAEAYFARHHPSLFAFREQLYSREIKLPYRRGTVLFYRLDVWHRGTPMATSSQSRAVVNLMYKSNQSATRITQWHKGWATNAYNSWALPNRTFPPQVGAFEQLFASLTSQQRTCLGFPSPTDREFWTPSMLTAVRNRYPDMDLSEYQASKY
ncbi:hypothetical protein BASA81_015311 [Batrachochytrium salamandrivorans]|nr:hypothetical protein BASA81_015311 [Batrachochytrium salamandrivorans]